MPIVKSLTVYRGEDIELNFSMRPARDITGWVISMTVAESYNSLTKTIQVTATNTNAPAGRFQILLTKAQLNITPMKYVYDVFRVNPGNNRILNIGDFNLFADVRNP